VATAAEHLAPEPVTPTTVRVTGGDGDLGRRVLAQLAADHDVVLAGAAGAEGAGDDAASVDVVVHVGGGDHDARARRRENITEGVVESLAEAIERDANHLVLVSSAMVYGAWPNNPVPLTEDAILRPDVDFVFARQLAAAEAMADHWRRQRTGRTVTVLRPVVAMAADGSSRLARALAAGLGQRFGEEDPPAQFLHLDDLAGAVGIAVRRRLDGVYNVAPDGWVAGERVRALTGEPPRIKLPDRAGEVIGALRWRFQRGPIPPGLRSYTRAPWVVANDRLKAEGWQPTVTNEQAYVEGTEGKWWTMVSPKRRQEIALGAMVIVALAGVVGVAGAIRRWRRRR
jgi:nucleoside-diphosphate-sugar epimerase